MRTLPGRAHPVRGRRGKTCTLLALVHDPSPRETEADGLARSHRDAALQGDVNGILVERRALALVALGLLDLSGPQTQHQKDLVLANVIRVRVVLLERRHGLDAQLVVHFLKLVEEEVAALGEDLARFLFQGGRHPRGSRNLRVSTRANIQQCLKGYAESAASTYVAVQEWAAAVATLQRSSTAAVATATIAAAVAAAMIQ